MSFDKNYPNRKDQRQPYRKSDRFDTSCRCHGGCPWCERNKQIQKLKVEEHSKQDLKIFENETWADIEVDLSQDPPE